MAETTSPLAVKLTAACTHFDIQNTDSILLLTEALDKISPELAKDSQARYGHHYFQ